MDSKKDFLSYISKCIKQQGSYAAAAVAPLLDKLVEKVFKNTEAIEKLAQSGANGGGKNMQFVAKLGEIRNPEVSTGYMVWSLANTQGEIDEFLNKIKGEQTVFPSVVVQYQGGSCMLYVWIKSNDVLGTPDTFYCVSALKKLTILYLSQKEGESRFEQEI
jgi:hypothetical protein|nr:MAG TPA: hypothetical protein [Bacteriophage sp.]